MLVEAGGARQLIVWLSESLNSLDPRTGKPYWTIEYPAGRPPTRPAVNIITVVPHGRLLLVSTAYHGTMVVELDQDKPVARALWSTKSNRMDKPEGLHCLMATPVVKDGHIFGVGAMGDLRCIEARTGKQKWQTFDLTGGAKADCGTAFLIPQGGRYVAFNDSGELLLAELSPAGHKVISRAKVIAPVEKARGREVVWSHPAFADRCVFVRNDQEMVCLSLAA
jgi:outer membrane protein assembly factor BamB